MKSPERVSSTRVSVRPERVSTTRVSIRPSRLITERISVQRPIEKVTRISRPSCACIGHGAPRASRTSVTQVHTCPLCNTTVTRRSARRQPNALASMPSVTSINFKENMPKTGTFGSPNVKTGFRKSTRNSNNQRKLISTRKR